MKPWGESSVELATLLKGCGELVRLGTWGESTEGDAKREEGDAKWEEWEEGDEAKEMVVASGARASLMSWFNSGSCTWQLKIRPPPLRAE